METKKNPSLLKQVQHKQGNEKASKLLFLSGEPFNEKELLTDLM